MITVYEVSHNNSVVEFLNLSAAENYAQLYNLSAPVEKQKTVDNRPAIPNATPRQIRQALILSGVNLQDIEDALDSMPEPTRTLAKIEWEYSVAFVRENALTNQVGQMLGWTSAQLDDLWTLALSL
jgi:hypothetical protein